jgi:hypothetical protein
MQQSLTEKFWEAIQAEQERTGKARLDMRRMWGAIDNWHLQPEDINSILEELERAGLIVTYQDEEGLEIIACKTVWCCPDCNMTVDGLWSGHLEDCMHRQRLLARYQRQRAEASQRPR